MSALFIGRFQPFHKGHLQAIKNVLTDLEKTKNLARKKNDGPENVLYIAIGSTQFNYRPANPFTVSERWQMIEAALTEAKIPRSKYNISSIPNIDNYALWVQHVQIYLPPIQKIYTGSEIVSLLYKDYNKLLKHPYKIIPIKKELKVSSSEIRKLMLKGGKWQKLLPPSIEKLIQKWGGVERLKKIQETER